MPRQVSACYLVGATLCRHVIESKRRHARAESRRVDIESPTNLFAALFNPLPHLDDGVFGLADGRQGVIIRRPFAHRKLVEDPEKQY